MRIAVLIKQVPGDMNVSMRADFTLNRSGAKTITNRRIRVPWLLQRPGKSK